MKYNVNFGPSLLIAMVLVCILGIHSVFAGETKRFEVSPYVDFNGSIHGGIFDHYSGIAAGVGGGCEVLFVANDNFAVGVNGKTNLNFDAYFQDGSGDNVLVDEYGTWTATLGGIMYIGEMFYMSYMAIYHVDTFHESTYLSGDDGDIEQKKLPYTIDEMNYLLEIGLRLSYHMSVYADITTHLIETEADRSKYQIYLGLKYHI